ncbi:MAG: hypothetical protein CM1200mP27_01000 [Chloroflexota bacterium]|nr:MAG: hypothetical protein CM1200mP27_01000 [Chloroflexota bacterium]
MIERSARSNAQTADSPVIFQIPNGRLNPVLYDHKNSAIEDLARAAATGFELSGATVLLKRITEATQADLLASDGLLLGSPNWSGITGSLKSWLDPKG